MAFASSPIFPRQPISKPTVVAASTIATYDIATAPAEGMVINKVHVLQKGTATVNFELRLVDGATTTTLFAGSITGGASNDVRDLLADAKAPVDETGRLFLGASDILRLAILNSAANALDVTVFGANFTQV
jgi:hypothetical protein